MILINFSDPNPNSEHRPGFGSGFDLVCFFVFYRKLSSEVEESHKHWRDRTFFKNILLSFIAGLHYGF